MASADYAEAIERATPPYELSLAFQLEKWGVSAVWNGRVPFNLLKRMSAAKNVYDAFISYRAGMRNAARWAEQNPSALDIVTMIRELRERYA